MTPRAKRTLRIVLVAPVFVWGLPRIADFAGVRAAVLDISWLASTTLVVAPASNIATSMFVAIATLPGLSFSRRSSSVSVHGGGQRAARRHRAGHRRPYAMYPA